MSSSTKISKAEVALMRTIPLTESQVANLDRLYLANNPWQVVPDGMPNEMWTIRNAATGETLKTDTAPGWYRTRSWAKADRDAQKLNRRRAA